MPTKNQLIESAITKIVRRSLKRNLNERNRFSEQIENAAERVDDYIIDEMDTLKSTSPGSTRDFLEAVLIRVRSRLYHASK